MDDTPQPTESQLAASLCKNREWLAQLRKQHLTPGDDFVNIPGQGITYTPAGLQKIKSALDAQAPVQEPEKTETPPVVTMACRTGKTADTGVTLEVLRPSPLGRQAVCCVPGDPAARRFVTVHAPRVGATTLTRGQRLQGCRQRFAHNAEVFDYHGPVPRRKGQPIPEGGAA